MAEETNNDANADGGLGTTRRVAYLLALAALVLPCGLLIVATYWIYRQVRGLLRGQPRPANRV